MDKLAKEIWAVDVESRLKKQYQSSDINLVFSLFF